MAGSVDAHCASDGDFQADIPLAVLASPLTDGRMSTTATGSPAARSVSARPASTSKAIRSHKTLPPSVPAARIFSVVYVSDGADPADGIGGQHAFNQDAQHDAPPSCKSA